MKKIEAIIRPDRFDAVREALTDLNVQGMTVTEVRGYGNQKGYTETYRGTSVDVKLLPKVKIEVFVRDQWAGRVIDAISAAARTGQVGDGKIAVFEMEDCIRVRTGERGDQAI